MNPFSLSFGKVPRLAISRDKQIDEIVDGFTSGNPDYKICLITGVSGSGKTVLLREVASGIKSEKGWIIIELSPERDMLYDLATELEKRTGAQPSLSSGSDMAEAADRMLGQLSRKGKHVLICLDDAVPNAFVRDFTSHFRVFMRKNYNVCLLMAGHFDKIYDLQNEERLKFLRQVPKVRMQPLNYILISKQYQHVFNIPDSSAKEMARLVKGYPYAYQVLGYLCYKNKCSYVDVLDEFDACLSEYVYDEIWAETSDKDRQVIRAIAASSTGKTNEIRELAGMSSGEFSVYRDRLLKKGIIVSERYAHLDFTLPRFGEYALLSDRSR